METQRPRPQPRPPEPAPAATWPRTERCIACDRLTTHVRDGCTRCMARGENRRQGALFGAIGAALLVLGVGLTWHSFTRAVHVRGGAATLLLVLGGGALLVKGLRALVTGSDPEA